MQPQFLSVHPSTAPSQSRAGGPTAAWELAKLPASAGDTPDAGDMKVCLAAAAAEPRSEGIHLNIDLTKCSASIGMSRRLCGLVNKFPAWTAEPHNRRVVADMRTSSSSVGVPIRATYSWNMLSADVLTVSKAGVPSHNSAQIAPADHTSEYESYVCVKVSGAAYLVAPQKEHATCVRLHTMLHENNYHNANACPWQKKHKEELDGLATRPRGSWALTQ